MWKLDMKQTALILIDLQNGIVNRKTQPYSADEVIERSRKLAEAFRAKSAPVIYIHVIAADMLDLPTEVPTSMDRGAPASANDIAGATGMQSGDLLIAKRHWGAFAQTNLEAELHRREIKTIVLAGIATNMGVESTLRQGTGLGFGFVTVENACGTYTAEMHEFAFRNIFPRLSMVRTTQQVLQATG